MAVYTGGNMHTKVGTVILSYWHTGIMSHCHTVILSYCNTVILSTKAATVTLHCHTNVVTLVWGDRGRAAKVPVLKSKYLIKKTIFLKTIVLNGLKTIFEALQDLVYIRLPPGINFGISLKRSEITQIRYYWSYKK